MWGFIALIIIVAIAFGITLQGAFWLIIAIVGVACAACWMFATESGKKFAKTAIIVLGVVIGGLIAISGITKKTGDETQYNKDAKSCEEDWRYYRAKVYSNNYQSYYYDSTKVQEIYDDCMNHAAQNRKVRNDWWWVEAGVGIVILGYALSLRKEKTLLNAEKQRPSEVGADGSSNNDDIDDDVFDKRDIEKK